jgi:hypothetical protein
MQSGHGAQCCGTVGAAFEVSARGLQRQNTGALGALESLDGFLAFHDQFLAS